MVGYRDGVVVEGGISYAGDGAVARARLALEVLRERLGRRGIAVSDLRTDIIGVDFVLLRGAVVDARPAGARRARPPRRPGGRSRRRRGRSGTRSRRCG
ncbi:MAG: hypothetical protein RML45_00560 [Acetobacteraceae bacterium]|nr:hypothetical protein [Acetobacteraceae bacterium]